MPLARLLQLLPVGAASLHCFLAHAKEPRDLVVPEAEYLRLTGSLLAKQNQESLRTCQNHHQIQQKETLIQRDQVVKSLQQRKLVDLPVAAK